MLEISIIRFYSFFLGFIFLVELVLQKRCFDDLEGRHHAPNSSNEANCMEKLSVCYSSGFIEFLTAQAFISVAKINKISECGRIQGNSFHHEHASFTLQNYELCLSTDAVFFLNIEKVLFPWAVLIKPNNLFAWMEFLPVVESPLYDFKTWKIDLDLFIQFIDESFFTDFRCFLNCLWWL